MSMRKLSRLALTIASAGTLVAGVAAPALAADTGVTGKVSTSGLQLNVRAGASTDTEKVKTLKPGTKITIECQEVGQRIAGRVRTTKLWDRLTDGAYVSDAYISRKAKPPLCEDLDEPVGQVMPPATHAETPTASASGWVAPIPGIVGSGFRTKERPSHDGVDIGAKKHTPILATAAGTVIVSECNASTNNCDVDGSPKVLGCGWYVEVRHLSDVVTRYCHMIKRPSVKVGDKVKAGQVIGYVGSSGNSSGPHLHFEVHTGSPATRKNATEPTAFLKAQGVAINP
jgi:murein DD-endopeptidase MepM/ murein hydrolase activator NlpD